MTEIIYIYDVYNAINIALFGSIMVFGFYEGDLGIYQEGFHD